MDEWPGPELKAVYDPTRSSPPARDDPALLRTMAPEELRERSVWRRRNARELAEQGVYVVPHSASGAIEYFALDQGRAEQLLRERCSDGAELRYLGASMLVLHPHPFGSWLADGRSLHIFFGLPHNGEEFAGCTVAERDDRVIVALSIVDWLGAKTLIGGFTPSHAPLTLDAELGGRPVIDNFDNRVRPHWKAAAQIPLPRPQDL
jgi:hypothetical protein